MIIFNFHRRSEDETRSLQNPGVLFIVLEFGNGVRLVIHEHRLSKVVQPPDRAKFDHVQQLSTITQNAVNNSFIAEV